MGAKRPGFKIRRELLLTEIARRCRGCDAPARLGLTKEEARDYAGFECEACELWNEDELRESDIPEWWEELRVTGLASLRPRATGGEAGGVEEPDPVARLSDAWRAGGRDGGDAPRGGLRASSRDDEGAAAEDESL
jgi:hypothetical protein